ncbi:hypothetical protein [Flagellimonas nanhaiensis]|uniref:Uncharacterized protein n=1 Tax=Flagellimonas nanhaiensis TaxID=2292706 RepID=A0A371JNV8_9FLAO|nr:hypothetical protein [Allomuricauda nanhaiensis]RDY58904.1 hypothetical protein DX873_14695 [Allomuricauda nanhaiensis]
MGEGNKLLASDIIQADDAFISEVAKKVQKVLQPETKEGERKYTIKEIAKLGKRKPQTVRKHINNWLNNYDGSQLKAEKERNGKLWYAKKKDVEEYLKIKLP